MKLAEHKTVTTYTLGLTADELSLISWAIGRSSYTDRNSLKPGWGSLGETMYELISRVPRVA